MGKAKELYFDCKEELEQEGIINPSDSQIYERVLVRNMLRQRKSETKVYQGGLRLRHEGSLYVLERDSDEPWVEGSISESIDRDCLHHVDSRRLNAYWEAEATGPEWLKIAEAIESGQDLSFKRVGIAHEPEGVVWITRPRSNKTALVTKESALGLARNIRKLLGS